MIQRLCVIGVGLIGGSLARALRRAGVCEEVVGGGRNTAHLQRAVELGVVDRYATDLSDAVAGADLVVVAVPLGAVRRVLAAIVDHLAPEAVVTDVGSAKGSVLRDARATLGDRLPMFVPGHPIAGTERAGVDASFAELFEGRRVILTPTADTDNGALASVRRMWRATGAEVIEMDVGHHDEMLAATSHLPHVLAYTLVDSLARLDDKVEIFDFAAGGFRDFTRIASSDPKMWHDICLANSEAILKVLERFEGDLARVAIAIRDQDSAAIIDVFTRAKKARDSLCGH